MGEASLPRSLFFVVCSNQDVGGARPPLHPHILAAAIEALGLDVQTAGNATLKQALKGKGHGVSRGERAGGYVARG